MVASGLVSDSIAAAATFWLRLSECGLFTDYFSPSAVCLQIIPFSGSMPDLRGVSAGGLLALYPGKHVRRRYLGRAAGCSDKPSGRRGNHRRDSKQKSRSANDLKKRLPDPRQQRHSATGSGFHEQDPMGDADMPYSMKTAAGSTAPAAGAAPTSPLVEWIRRGVIGGDEVLTGPYGPAAKAALQRALARGHLSPGICATRCGQAGNSGNATTTAPAARLLPAPAAPGLTRLARQAGPAQAAAAGPPSSPPCRRVVVPRTSRCARRGNPASAPGARPHIAACP